MEIIVATYRPTAAWCLTFEEYQKTPRKNKNKKQNQNKTKNRNYYEWNS